MNDGVALVREILNFGITPDHDEYTYVHQTLARVAQCIGEPFIPFLPAIIPTCMIVFGGAVPLIFMK